MLRTDNENKLAGEHDEETLINHLKQALGEKQFTINDNDIERLAGAKYANAVKPLTKILTQKRKEGDSEDDYLHFEKLRKKAAWALGEIGDKRAVKPLLKLLSYKKHKYIYAYEITQNTSQIIGKSNKDRRKSIYFNLLIEVFEALGKIGDKRAFEPLLCVYMDFNGIADGHIRIPIVSAFGKLGDKRAFELLLGHVEKHTFTDERRAALKSLVELFDKRTPSKLRKIYNKLSTDKFRDEIGEALEKIKANSECIETNHKWNGCLCTVCGSMREEGHEWDGCECRICNLNRPHEWHGCTCIACGYIRDRGDVRGKYHEWNGCTCTICGLIRGEGHHIVGCICTICKNEFHDSEYVVRYVNGKRYPSNMRKCKRCGKEGLHI